MENTDPDEVELDMEVKPDANDSPVHELERDPAAEAFARLEGELAMMRRAVQHLAAERADIVIPDYGATLSQMAKRLGQIDECLNDIADQPAMQMTPDSIGSRISEAAELARRTDHERIGLAQKDLHHAAQVMRAVTTHSRTTAEQRRAMFQAAGSGLLAGILLWSVLPGTIARTMPESWHWPERMAARMVGGSSRWDAGAHLMQSDNPHAWNAIVQVADIQRDNRDAIDACKKSSANSQKPVRCTIRIRAETEPGQ